MTQAEKTVFISYRRTNIGYALAVYQNLTNKGFDCFFDYNSINSGDFSQIILNNIASRAHFIVLLTPSALERLSEEGDWLRREMEYAIETKRNIIPLTLESFDWASASQHLTGKLEAIQQYNALRVPPDYFEEAMNKLANRRLNVALDAVIHPRSVIAQKASDQAREETEAQPIVTEEKIENELIAEIWFHKALEASDKTEVITYYSMAVKLKPDFALAYYNRGNAQKAQGNLDGALEDYNTTIKLKPDYVDAYYNRGVIRQAQGDFDKARQEYTQTIDLDSHYINAYNNRGIVLEELGYLDGALKDYNQAIALDANYASAYNNRGALYFNIYQDYHKAKADFAKAFQLNPNDNMARNNLELVERLLQE